MRYWLDYIPNREIGSCLISLSSIGLVSGRIEILVPSAKPGYRSRQSHYSVGLASQTEAGEEWQLGLYLTHMFTGERHSVCEN
jgi:hypothetical protein